MAQISNLFSRQILDSRGIPTLETICVLSDGSMGVASAPTDISIGSYEAQDLRDQDPQKYMGLGLSKALANINSTIASKLVNLDLKNTSDLDAVLISLDATPNKSSLGANSILSVSFAFTKAIAASRKVPVYKYISAISHNDQNLFLPEPIFSIISGGAHGASNLDFEDFQVVLSSSKKYSRKLELAVVFYHTVKSLLARKGQIHSVGDNGGFAPNLFTNGEAFEILKEASSLLLLKPYEDIEFGLDIAANTFYKDGFYSIKDKPMPLSKAEFIDYLVSLQTSTKLRLIEDGLSEDDWEGWAILNSKFGSTSLVVGDNLLVSNEHRVQNAISQSACNAIVVKPSQVGTVTETLNVIRLAKMSGWKTILSSRTGETNDTFIVDLAVGAGIDYVKFGAPSRGERVAKYNRLLAIESELA